MAGRVAVRIGMAVGVFKKVAAPEASAEIRLDNNNLTIRA
jgi:hypothetical protein